MFITLLTEPSKTLPTRAFLPFHQAQRFRTPNTVVLSTNTNLTALVVEI